MNNSEFEKSLFNDLAAKHGKNSKSLNYGSEQSKIIRSIKASEIIHDMIRSHSLKSTILDIGCGFCDLFSELEKLIEIDHYTGVDIAQNVIDLIDKDITTDERVTIICGDYFNMIDLGNMDIVANIGALNYDHNLDSVVEKITKMYNSSNIGTVFTLSSSIQPVDERGSVAYWDPAEIVKLMFHITPYVRLDHDYLKREMLISLTKNATV